MVTFGAVNQTARNYARIRIPGSGRQFVGMGKDLYDNVPLAKELFDRANEILGFPITDIMFAGTDEQLKQTKVTQPAIFLHSVILARSLGDAFKPDMAAGSLAGRVQRAGSRRSARLRGRAEARVEARYGRCRKPASRIPRRWPRSSRCRTKRSRRSARRSTAWSFRPITTARASSSFRARTRRSTRPAPS